jgi:glucokinase
MGGLLINGGQITPLASEGGHATFAATTPLEADVAQVLRNRFGHVSNERILSGPGLVNIFEALSRLRHDAPIILNPQEITERATTHIDSRCVQSLEFFCAALGSVAGDLALLLCADAIYISGGIVPRIIDFLRLSAFRERFEDKGRFAARVARIPTFIITDPQPGLLGAAADLLQYK